MEIQAFHDAHQITHHGQNMPRPILAFEEAGFPGKLLTLCETVISKLTILCHLHIKLINCKMLKSLLKSDKIS